MRGRVKLLSLTVWITVALLTLGAILVVLGIFNEVLKWDIFGPQIEAILYGIFWGSVALAFFGVAITFVLGIQEIVQAVSALNPSREEAAIAPQTKRITYVAYMMAILAALSAIIAVLSAVNSQIQVHRSRVFKKIATEQMQVLGNKFDAPLSKFNAKPSNTVPKSIYDLMKTLNNLSFVENTTLYIADPQDESVLWSYQVQAWVDYKDRNQFERFFVAKESEKAIQKTLTGDAKALKAINNKTNFTWYYAIEKQPGKPMGVLKIDGKQGENFREYALGS